MGESRRVFGLKEIDPDSPQVKIPPPFVFLGCLILGLLLHNLVPMFLVSREQRGWWGAMEEKYLESKFGEPYLNYKHKVRRWV